MPRRPPSDTPSPSGRPSKRRRADSVDSWHGQAAQPLVLYLVQAKLDQETISELYHLIDTSDLPLELCSDIAHANVIITSIRMRKRLERHIDWPAARQKAVVTPDWLRESVRRGRPAPCGPFAAVSELHDQTSGNCSDREHENGSPSALPSPPLPTLSSDPIKIVKSTSEKVINNWRSRYACTRASPLACQNQDLVVALNILGHSRELEGLAANALAYERAVAVLKSYPYPITREAFERDVVKLPGIGAKVRAKIEEYLNSGKIEESEDIRRSERYQSLTLFTSIYGVGPSTARELYDTGLRSIDDLERYYDLPTDFSATEPEESTTLTPNGRSIPSEDTKIPSISMRVALALRKDFEIPIPRIEVEDMHRVIMRELEEVQTGCVSTIVGGYRRGKTESNDVDIIISHSDLEKGGKIIKGLCTKFTERLHQRGLLTHVMHLSGFHAHNPLRVQHWDPLEKALTVFRLPSTSHPVVKAGKQGHLHRRLDLIFAPPEAYWTAVIGWSGSRMFERDLRLWAKVEKGMKFDSSSLTRRHDSKPFIPKSEEEVFKILDLEWIDPTLRNANV